MPGARCGLFLKRFDKLVDAPFLYLKAIEKVVYTTVLLRCPDGP